ncbi:MAG: hypothetical protein HZC48_08500 [Nitrospirae bacterium]|nr:hypothetical protein [Nitrospirota bacterium]
MKKYFLLSVFSVFVSILIITGRAMSAQTITAVKVTSPPVIDGAASDSVWKFANAVTVKDVRTGGDVTLKALYTDEQIYFLVTYPDKTEDRLQKPWVWDKGLKAYSMGPQREDTFNFNWNMESKEVDLSEFSDDTYTSDVWYWKANRSDPSGYADDKLHTLASTSGKKAQDVISKSNKKRYLTRNGDEGEASEKKRLLTDYEGDVVDQHISVTPTGSRADIKAKGLWKAGFWTIEFARKLNTGHTDDIQFSPSSGKKYLFGISIAGLYGEPIDKTAPHWYGQGRISENLYLVFK